MARILPNLKGGGFKPRTLYYRVIESVMLYGAPIWARGAITTKSFELLHQTQKRGLARIVRAYRTVSHEALCVLSGHPPLILVAEERKRIFERTKDLPRDGITYERMHRKITVQINLHTCRLAHDLLTQYVYENEVDIILISEPYRILDTWYGDK
ncbi:uncharacterized protein LOC144477502 [Augochlora pura]